MIYQLVHHDNVNFTTVEQSEDLQSGQEKTEWYSRATFGKQLPEGRQWGVVDTDHPWFVRADEKQVDPESPLSFEEVVHISQERTLEERKRSIENREKLTAYMAEFQE